MARRSDFCRGISSRVSGYISLCIRRALTRTRGFVSGNGVSSTLSGVRDVGACLRGLKLGSSAIRRGLGRAGMGCTRACTGGTRSYFGGGSIGNTVKGVRITVRLTPSGTSCGAGGSACRVCVPFGLCIGRGYLDITGRGSRF